MTEYLHFLVILVSVLSFLASLYLYRKMYLLNKDQVDVAKMLLDLLEKEFQSNQVQHTDLLENFNEINKRTNDQIAETRKNIFNLAVFLGYRPRNLEDL